MKIVAFLLNLPWTVIGLLAGILSIPKNILWNKNPAAIILKVRSFWWYSWLPGMRGVRAMAIGNTVLLGPRVLEKDLEHELVHVQQAMRTPLIHPLLYWLELVKYGYRGNKYEKEAYAKAGNIYRQI